MKVSNIVIATVAGISTAGALGLAYAQSSSSEPQRGTSAPMTQDASPGTIATEGQAATPGAMDRGGDASQDSPDSTRTTRSYNERVARADRN